MAVVCAIILTNFHSPLVRRYRSILISVAFSGIALGIASWATPMILRQLNPDQSRLTPIHQLTITQREEPLENPMTGSPEVTEDEMNWAKKVGYRFKYKMNLLFESQRLLTILESMLVILDKDGSIRGFNAYTGLNHWQIALGLERFIDLVQFQKKLFLLDHSSIQDGLRVTCLDLQNPSVLWQRHIPNSRDGAIQFDYENQNLLISAGTNGVWAIRSKTGEMSWKRPEIYTRLQVTIVGKTALAFEPSVVKKAGSWHFLDLLTGNTQQKVLHVYPDLLDAKNLGNVFLARSATDQLFALNLPSINPLWSTTTAALPVFYELLSNGSYLIFHENQTLELRAVQDNELQWQKKLSDVEGKFIRFSADRSQFALPLRDQGAVGFYSTESGDYLAQSVNPEPVVDFAFYGDWMYLLSENRLWAFQK